jgi:2,3-bisphosphoglycerate-dependent phosphoglycerate mutase
MQFYFIRHGQSQNNHLWANTGTNEGRHEDPELTPLGQQQAALLAEYLSQRVPAQEDAEQDATPDWWNGTGYDITHVYCSLMVRAVATGNAVATALNLPLIGLRDAHETGGIYLEDPETGAKMGLPGRTRAYFEEHYSNLVLPDDVDGNGWWNRPFEEREERRERAERLVAALLARHKETEDRVALISHGGFYNHILTAMLNLPEECDYWFSLNNTGITRIDFREGRIWVGYMNRVDFLPRELIT